MTRLTCIPDTSGFINHAIVSIVLLITIFSTSDALSQGYRAIHLGIMPIAETLGKSGKPGDYPSFQQASAPRESLGRCHGADATTERL